MSEPSSTRPPDVVSSITDDVLPNHVPPQEARSAGRFGYDKPAADNCIVLLIDHQIGLMAGVRDFTPWQSTKAMLWALHASLAHLTSRS